MVDDRDARLAAEACRLHQRYTVEIVERFNLCPWAHRARLDGQVGRRALLQCSTEPGPTLQLLSELEAAPDSPVVMIAVYPRLAVSARDFDAFVAAVKALDQERHGGRPIYVSASFHPEYPFD